MNYLYSFRSEWLKKQKSAADWLTILGAFFIPVIMLIGRLKDWSTLPQTNLAPGFWDKLNHNCWQFMAMFLLPMGVIMATSLVTQLEFRNNAWKQLHCTPQRLTTIYFAKLGVILVMMIQFFLLFNIGIYIAGALPSLFPGIPYPTQPIPFMRLLEVNGKFFIDCLPIIALQYLISLQFKNFLVPIGVGLVLLTASIMSLYWKYGYVFPYSYCAFNFIGKKVMFNNVNLLHYWAFGYFILFIILGYILYINRKEKG